MSPNPFFNNDILTSVMYLLEEQGPSCVISCHWYEVTSNYFTSHNPVSCY